MKSIKIKDELNLQLIELKYHSSFKSMNEVIKHLLKYFKEGEKNGRKK